MNKNKKILVANWKMNPDNISVARSITENLKKALRRKKKIKLIVCPPFIFMSEVAEIIGNSKTLYLGAQDVFGGENKTTTGEVNAEMLSNLNIRYVIVGHSSRRGTCETDEIVADKVLSSIKSGITPILCIGESERDENGRFYLEVKNQLEKSLAKVKKDNLSKIIIAYEPVWAIGKKDSDAINSENLHEMVIFIKKVLSDRFGVENSLNIPIIYGGSVTKRNVSELTLKGEVSGLLVGRESLKIDNFTEVINILESI